MKFAFSFVLILYCFYSLHSQDLVEKRSYQTHRLLSENIIKVDGDLGEDAWSLVEWSSDYVELSPEENTDPTEQTSFKILYDEKNIYVAFRCFDKEPSKVVRRLSRRDGFEGDWVEINIASLGDERTAQSFTISASGVKGEEYITNNGNNWDPTWNPIWYAKTQITEIGWEAEIRIPLTQLRFGASETQSWAIQSTRRYFRNEERSVWQRNPGSAAGWVSNFGELKGLKDIEPQNQLELQPYVVAAHETYESETGNPFMDGSDQDVNIGFDGKVGVTNDLTLDFTINPDFGQVEADPSAIALDGFQIFFQERRPFFIENKNIFDYQFSSSASSGNTFGFDNLFYSRRIGRAPQKRVFPVIGSYVSQPDITTILGAAKFSGKTQSGWSIGVLESLTSEENATIRYQNDEDKIVVEPMTNYFVGRLQKDFNEDRTFLGGILTSTIRNGDKNELNIHKSAHTSGLDFTHQWKNRAYFFKANLIMSHVAGSKASIGSTQKSIAHLFQREEADHLEFDSEKEELMGTGGNVQLGKTSGNWRFQSGMTWRSPELEINDLGFQQQADDIRQYAWLSYRTITPLEKLRSYNINLHQLLAWDFGKNLNQVSLGLNSWINFKNNWWTNHSVTIRPLQYSISGLRGGPRLKLEESISYAGSLSTDSRKKVRASINFSATAAAESTIRRNSFGISIDFQPINAIQISVSPSYATNDDRLQYVTTTYFNSEKRYLNARIKQKTFSAPLRLDYIFTPNLSLQYWGQPFISRGIYSDFKSIDDPLHNDFEKRVNRLGEQQISLEDGIYQVDEDQDGIEDYGIWNPDFSFIQWRSNLVARWEFIPGSELFLVWSQDISTLGLPEDELFESLKTGIIETKPQNIFLIKATYRFIK